MKKYIAILLVSVFAIASVFAGGAKESSLSIRSVSQMMLQTRLEE